MPIQSLADFDDGPDGIGSTVCSQMESSRSSRAMKRRNMLSQKTLQESFLLPAEGAVTFDCMFCTESYKQHEDLGKHVLAKHRPTLCEPTVLRVEAEFLSPQEKRRRSAGSTAEEAKEENEGSDCEVCGQTFTDSSDLETHMKKHKDSFTYSCNICGRRFKEPWFLKNHKKTHSSRTGGKNRPQPASESPITINEIVQEPLTKSLTSPYKLCMICGFYFPDKETLMDHSKIHNKGSKLAGKSTNTSSGNENVNANEGAQKIPNRDFLNFLNLRPISAPPKKPETARKWIGEMDPFNTYQAWQLATKGKVALGHGQVKEPLFEVPVETDSSDKDEIVEFWNAVKIAQPLHVEERESVKSEDGEGSVSQDSYELKTNMAEMAECDNTPPGDNTPPSDQDKPNQCNDCGKLFKTYHQLVLHSRVHRKDRSDSESSASSDGLVIADSPDTPADPEDEGSKDVSEWEEGGADVAAMDKNDDDQSAVQNKGPPASRQCGYCRKSFRSNYYLNIHLRTHTGEKPYKCEFCDYAAAQKTSLRYHLERHHKFKPGESNARVKSISKSLQLLKKVAEPSTSSAGQVQERRLSKLHRKDDQEDPLMGKPPKRMSALRNRLVNARQGLKNELMLLEEREKVKTEETRAAAPCLAPKTPSPTLDEVEISLACAETLDDDLCFIEETTTQDPNAELSVEPVVELDHVVELDQSPMDLCITSAKNLSAKLYNRALLAMRTCPYCTYKTLYPEVMSMHQRLTHKQNHDHLHKGGLRAKNPSLVLKMRRTGCPPALQGVDVSPIQLGNKPKARLQPKPAEKPKRMPPQASKVVNPASIEQENKPHPVQPSRNLRYMQPDLQGITHLLERMPKAEQANQWNPSTSQKSGGCPFPVMPVWSGEQPFTRPAMVRPELGEPFTKGVKHNITNAVPPAYLNAEVGKRLHPGQVSVIGPEMAPGKSMNPPVPNKHPFELDPHWNVLKPYEHTAAGPLYRNAPLAPGSASAMEATHAPLYQRISKQGFGPNERPT